MRGRKKTGKSPVFKLPKVNRERQKESVTDGGGKGKAKK
jgi:hypothetical protein